MSRFGALVAACAVAAAVGQSAAQVPAFTYEVIDPAAIGIREIFDVDGDGLADVVARVGGPGEVASYVWYRWPDWSRHVLAGPANYRSDDFDPADIDGDGDLDLVFALDEPGRLHWYENPRPGGDPTTEWLGRHFIGRTEAGGGSDSYVKDVEVADFTGDGRLDVAARTHRRVFVFRQVTPTDWVETASVTIPDHEGMDSGDLDGDGDPDLLLNGFWLETPDDPAGVWLRHDIDARWFSQSSGSWTDNNAKVKVADMDGDGRLDALICHSEKAGFPVTWYAADDPRGGPWTPHVVADRLDFCHTLKAADMDGDGDLDVVAAEMPKSDDPDEVAVFVNGGGATTWSKQVVATTGSYSGQVGDLGADGDVDIVGCRSWDEPPIEWWENQSRAGPLPLDRWTYIRVDDQRAKWGDFDPPGWLKYFGLAFGDVNGDGEPDIVSGRYAYLSPGGDLAGAWQRVDLGRNVDAMLVVDVDGDAFGDVVAEALPDVLWLEATDGSAGAWRTTTVASLPPTGHVNSQGYAAAQIVPGGRPEILLAVGDGIHVLEIPADPTQPWPDHLVAATDQAGAVGVGDIDGDGRLDVAGIDSTGRVAWWRAPEDPRTVPWPAQEVGRTDAQWPDRVAVADLNGDGRPDILVTEEAQPETPTLKTYWFEAPAAPGGAWQRHTLATQYTTNSLDAADMDGDGDTDVITGEHRGTERVVIWENVDEAASWVPHVVAEGRESHLGARVFDIDGDGDLEVASIAWDDYADLHLWRNDARAGSARPTATAGPTHPTATAGPPTATALPPPTPPPGGRATAGLLALYTLDEGAGSVVHDVSGVGTPLDLTIEDPSATRWITGGLDVEASARVVSADPATKVSAACRASGEVTVEAWLRPANATQDGPARIVSLSLDSGTRNVTLGQGRWGDDPPSVFDVRLRTTATDPNGSDSLTTPAGTVTTALTHVAFTREASGRRRLYVDGRVATEGFIGGDLSSWDEAYPLLLANELEVDRPWLGELHLVALYGRALTPDEVAAHHRVGPDAVARWPAMAWLPVAFTR